MGLPDQVVNFLLNLVQGLGQWAGNDELWVKGSKAGANNPGIEAGEEQGHLAAIRSEQVAMGMGDPPEDAFETQTPEIIAHLRGRIGGTE